MSITFEPLKDLHFPLMLKWLETPHVKKWWDQDRLYTLDLVKEKYESYVHGYKQVDGVNKPIRGFIIRYDQNPIGYIQIYNAYDFPRKKPLTNLPENLGAFDIFIGEEAYIGKSIGSQVMTRFLSLYGNHYSYVLVDPDINNISAIKAYEKAGFKRVPTQPNPNELWMLWERPNPLQTIQKLIAERYSQAKAAFWAGSVFESQGTASSDLDIVIVFDSIPNAYREAFIYDSWPIDAFIHNPETLRYFFQNYERNDGRPALIQMILKGHDLFKTSFSNNIKELAQEAFEQKPIRWTQEQIDKERFLITDILDDIKFPKSREEQITSAAHLFEPLIQFYFRAQNKWAASGKSLMRLLKADNPDLALEFNQSFESVFQTGDSTQLDFLVQKIVAPYGGPLWDGFKADAPVEAKIPEAHEIGTFKGSYRLFLSDFKNDPIEEMLLKKLREYNQSKIGSYKRQHFSLFLESPEKEIIAGMSGDILGPLCSIQLFWVDEAYRGQGVGSRLIEEVEKYAALSECTIIQLDTTEFQAKGFYETKGYLVVATLEKGFMGYVQYVMRKQL